MTMEITNKRYEIKPALVLCAAYKAVLTKELVDEVLSTRCLDKLFSIMNKFVKERGNETGIYHLTEIEYLIYNLLEFREKRKKLNKAIAAVRKNRFSMGDDPGINTWIKLSRGRYIYETKPDILDSFQKSDYEFYLQEYQPATSDAKLDAEIFNLVRLTKGTRWYTSQNNGPTFESIRLEEKQLHSCIHKIANLSKYLTEKEHLTETFTIFCIKKEMSYMGFKDIEVHRKYNNIYSIVGTFNGKRYVTVA